MSLDRWVFNGLDEGRGFQAEALTNRQEARNSGSETLEDIRQAVREDRGTVGENTCCFWGLGVGVVRGPASFEKRVAPKRENHVHVLEDMYIPSLKLT